jgi:recombination protein RecA
LVVEAIMSVLERPSIQKAVSLLENRSFSHTSPTFTIANLTGRVSELSAPRNVPVLSFVSLLIREVQLTNEPAVWVAVDQSIFFPPDFSANGVDLSALPVVWAPHVRDAVRAVEHLLRSSAFTLVIVDLPPNTIIDQGRLGKLARLADLNDIALVLLNQQDDGRPFTLGSIISLRMFSERKLTGENEFQCVFSAVKDKHHTPGWSITEVFHGPDGMC